MTKKKILMIGTADNLGGAARVGWELGQKLRQRGWWVRYIVSVKRSDADYVYQLHKNKLAGLLDSLFSSRIVSPYGHLVSFVFANDIDYGSGQEILRHPWYQQADVVHLHNLHGNFFKLKTLTSICREKKVVWTLHDLWALTAHCAYCYDCGDWNGGKHHKFIWGKYGNMLWDNSDYLWNKKKQIYSQSKMQLISTSKWLDDYIPKSILANKPHTVILNGIDTTTFKPGSMRMVRKHLNLPLGKKVVLFVAQGGIADPRKGGRYFMEVTKRLINRTDIYFVCVGGQDNNGSYANVRFVPFIKNNLELANFYIAADLFLFSSLADNCPRTPLEAMATGLPVVAFDVGGVSEQITHKLNGYLARATDVNDLITGIEYILGRTQTQLATFHDRNIAKARADFSLDSMSAKYITVYNRL